MDADQTYLISEIKREQLLDLLQDREFRLRPGSRSEFTESRPAPGQVLAIWNTTDLSHRSPLPQVIVAEQAVLEDLFAWTATYLRGLGPLTAHTRVLVPAQLDAVFRDPPSGVWWRLASGGIGLIIGEVLAHASQDREAHEIGLAACRGTLSYVLMRTTALGGECREFDALTEMWAQLRAETGQAQTQVEPRTISAIAQAVEQACMRQGPIQRYGNSTSTWLERLISHGSNSELLEEIFSGVQRLPVNVVNVFTRGTAEEKVRVFDDVASQLADSGEMERSERAFAVALLAFMCRPGFAYQAGLLKPYVARMPEVTIWLGGLQGTVSLTETLAFGDGLGWRLARELFAPDDVFSTPRCDIALLELKVLLRGRGAVRMIKSAVPSRLDVELRPGVSAWVRNLQTGPVQQNLPLEGSPPSERPSYSSSATPSVMLAEAQRAIEKSLSLIRNIRLEATSRGEQKKRRGRTP